MESMNGTLSSCSTYSTTPRRRRSRRLWSDRAMDTAVQGRCRSLPPRIQDRLGSRGSVFGRQSEKIGNKSRDGLGLQVTSECPRMRVGVRVRPAFREEMLSWPGRSGGYEPAVTVPKDKRSIRYRGETLGRSQCSDKDAHEDQPKLKSEGLTSAPSHVELRAFNGRRRRFAFDYAFGPTCEQREIYESLAAPVVEGCLQGLHGLIMAYGQTGSGKSHTMGVLQGMDLAAPQAASFARTPPGSMDTRVAAKNSSNRESERESIRREATESQEGFLEGRETVYSANSACNEADPGIIPRALCRVFEHVESSYSSGPTQLLVKMSLLQIYNETVQDLLAPTAQLGGDNVGLSIRENPSVGFFVEGLREYAVHTPQEAATLMNLGLRQRATARTAKNDVSSRSHTVLTIALESRGGGASPSSGMDLPAMTEWQTGCMGRSKLVLVDLAGSERAGRSGRSGQGELGAERLREAGYINQSLSALGNVVAALGRAEVDRPHIPFRDSKLTRILADSLGGGANTALIATVGPFALDQAESLSTLVFASRCMRVRNSPVRHEENNQSETTLRLQAQLSSIQREFCRREALQQSRYETVITRLAQELDYARKGSSLAGTPRDHPDPEAPPPAPSVVPKALAVRAAAIATSSSCTGGCSPPASSDGSRETAQHKRCTGDHQRTDDPERCEEEEKEEEGERPAVSPRGLASEPATVGATEGVVAARSAKGSGMPLSLEPAAREMLGVALDVLYEVGVKGAGVLKQARGDQHQPLSWQQGQTPVDDGRGEHGALVVHTNDSSSVRNRMDAMQRLGRSREMCEALWEEAEAIMTHTAREKNRLEQRLHAETLERRRQEKKAERLRGALRHLLAEGDDFGCADPSPRGASERQPERESSSESAFACGADPSVLLPGGAGQGSGRGIVGRASDCDSSSAGLLSQLVGEGRSSSGSRGRSGVLCESGGLAEQSGQFEADREKEGLGGRWATRRVELQRQPISELRSTLSP